MWLEPGALELRPPINTILLAKISGWKEDHVGILLEQPAVNQAREIGSVSHLYLASTIQREVMSTTASQEAYAASALLSKST